MGSLKVLEKSLNFTAEKCTNPESNYTYIETFNEIHFKMA